MLQGARSVSLLGGRAAVSNRARRPSPVTPRMGVTGPQRTPSTRSLLLHVDGVLAHLARHHLPQLVAVDVAVLRRVEHIDRPLAVPHLEYDARAVREREIRAREHRLR